MRCQGTPTYAQHTVAWPTLRLDPYVVEEVNVCFEARGGGTHGEFRFEWLDFPGSSHPPALRVSCYSDGFPALLDPRVQAVLAKLRALRASRRDVSPERLMGYLEAEGIVASVAHVRGLAGRR